MRKTLFKILYDIFYNKKLLNIAIDNCFNGKKIILKDEDKAFIKRETTGIIEKLDEIDIIIDKISNVKVSKLNADILIILRMGIYEIKYMDKVPYYATINECVNIVKKSKSRSLSGYVNAVLRTYLRKIEKELDDKNLQKDKPLKDCYFRVYNDNEKDVLAELDFKNIGYAKYKGTLDFIYAKVYKTEKYKYILDLDNFKKGNILIEDASSIYMTDKLLDCVNELGLVKEKISIIDTCSAPGGKILGFVDLLKNYVIKSEKKIEINVKSFDISEEKIKKIKNNLKRLNTTKIAKNILIQIDIEKKDATLPDKNYKNGFDIVICDVPCTGLGVIGKKPDIKLNYSEAKRDSLVHIQRQILDVSSNYVKSKGILAYSTCTETNEENFKNIEWFLNKYRNFKKIFEKQIIHGDSNKSDGFYMCFLRKQ